MSIERNVKFLLSVLGVVFVIFGFVVVLYYVPQSTGFSSESRLLSDLKFIGFGIAIELLGLALIILGRK